MEGQRTTFRHLCTRATQCSIVESENLMGLQQPAGYNAVASTVCFWKHNTHTVPFAVFFNLLDNFYILIKQWFISEYVISYHSFKTCLWLEDCNTFHRD